MDYREIKHRNKVLRAYFEGRAWDKNSEYTLKRKLVLDSAQLLPSYPYLIEDEWEVESGRTDKGRGDLVFTDGTGCFAVVEVKWIDLENTGRTSSTKRTHKRKNVRKQATSYANIYAKQALDRLETVKWVEAFVFTNECDYPNLLEKINFYPTHW